MFKMQILFNFLQAMLFFSSVNAFQPSAPIKTFTSSLRAEESNEQTTSIEGFLKENYPEFATILLPNEDVWRALKKAEGYTIFAPNNAAFEKLGDKKRKQLTDPRNGETTEKIV